jgi:hypothetical protein
MRHRDIKPRNAEDWAVLQAILGEDEDDDSDHDGWMDDTTPAKILFIPDTNTDDKDVNDILESGDEDEDGDVDYGDASTLSVTLPSVSSLQIFLHRPNECARNSGTTSDGWSVEALRSMGDTGAGGGIFKAKNASSVPNLPNDMSNTAIATAR